MLDFQRDYWKTRLRFPDWYSRLEDELTSLFFPVVHDDPRLKAFRNQVYALIAELLVCKELPLAATGPDLDTARQPVDTVVIHHTEEDAAISLDRLSAIGLVRQYGFQYLADNVLGHRVRGQPIWSNHFREGQMVFFAYHWLIRSDGTAERLLEDSYIGWHAGDWQINTRSVGIALSGTYEAAIPPLPQIESAARVIHSYYPHVSRNSIVGHREVRKDLTCPGAYFLEMWKDMLVSSV
ncbi:MAG: N-acetylmuramoyl-L-alanine amidase [Chloroflexi bacterium]|nr:MAG: N-acetylmuramoyl-L-alanine amidase [Chloroflexota bacterium]